MERFAPDRRALTGGLLAGLTLPGVPALGRTQPAPLPAPPPEPDVVTVTADHPVIPMPTVADSLGRPSANVMLNGRGPFRFLVDTGSNTSVVSHSVAAGLGLLPAGEVGVLGLVGMSNQDYAILDRIDCGAASREQMKVVLLSGPALAGLDGILGMDMFARRRVRFDFRRNMVEIDDPRRRSQLPIDFPVRFRHGLLVEAEGTVGGIRTRCIIDTGGEATLVNRPLMERLLDPVRIARMREPVTVFGVTHGTASGLWMRVPRVETIGLVMRQMHMIGIHAPVFDQWELGAQPAALIGMDLLSKLEALQIDYRRNRLQLALRDSAERS